MARPGIRFDRSDLQRLALEALQNVGSKSAGQWEEWTGKAIHIRRRLSREEEPLVGPVKDIRGTPEALERVLQLGNLVEHLPAAVIRAEVHGERRQA